jgi:uncharacterized protein (TIGR02271 family)
LFDSRSEAEAARDQIAGRASNVRIIDQEAGSGSTGTAGSQGGGLWASIKDAFMPHEDRHAYAEGVRRGGYLLCATVEENQADEICSMLDRSGAVDFDQRQESWRSEGWSSYEPGSNELGSGGHQQQQQQAFAGTETAQQGFASPGGTQSPSTGAETRAEGNAIAEERIPLVEEQLKVGKREVERGGARVRSYVEERPVNEQVTLREEHVSVERRPVDRPVASGDLCGSDLLKERDVEMTETAEEAVVAKEARVREEVVLRKTAEERTENIQETVRRTDVEIEDANRSGGESGDRSAFFDGGTGSTGDARGRSAEFERDDLGRG